jgi:Fic family protein
MQIGKYVKQPTGYHAFVLNPFPPAPKILIPDKTQLLLDKATLVLGKLDGITQLLPDLDFFILMYITKEATKSNEIEGTQASMSDVIERKAEVSNKRPNDVDRILKYIDAMNYGLKRIKKLPLSLRFIREIHGEILTGTIDAIGKTPGEFRRTQNWINGGSIATAQFVPPPPVEMHQALDDFENFLYNDQEYPPLIQAALIHAQFETIHPFLDGNGRTGRLLTTFYLYKIGVLEQPVLYLSEYLMNNRQEYYTALAGYHQEQADIIGWLNFFLDGVTVIAQEAIIVSKKINILRQIDIEKIQILGRRAKNANIVLQNLYKLPIANIKKIQEWTKLSYPQANELVLKMVELKILEQKNLQSKYAREFRHSEYLKLFTDINNKNAPN